MTSKTKQKTYNVSAKLVVDVGFEVTAENLQDAVVKAQALRTGDILDFKASGLDHNDSEEPVITGVFQ